MNVGGETGGADTSETQTEKHSLLHQLSSRTHLGFNVRTAPTLTFDDVHRAAGADASLALAARRQRRHATNLVHLALVNRRGARRLQQTMRARASTQ